MHTMNQTLLNALNEVSKKDLQFTQRVIRRAIGKKVSIEEALKMEQFVPGDKVNFLVQGQILQGNVKRVNPVKIKIVDRKTKREFSVVPDAVQPVQRITRQRRQEAEAKKVAPAEKAKVGRRPGRKAAQQTLQ